MMIFLIICVFFVLALAYLLFVPINVSLEINFGEKVLMVSALRFFPFEYKFISGKPKKAEKIKRPEPEMATRKAKEELKKKTGKKLRLSRLSRSDIGICIKVISEILRFFGGIIGSPKYFLRANIAGGASEPDITGELYGAYHAIRPIMPNAVSINYNPDFAAEKFNGRIEAGFIVRISSLLKETLIFIIRLPIIKLIRLYRKLRKDG